MNASAPPDRTTPPRHTSIAPYLKEIGRGKEGARDMSAEQAQALMTLILDGHVSDLSLGGFALAMRIKGESATELQGFVAAALARTLPLGTPPSTPVLLPSYNGARRLPNFTPLLALLLARAGVPVLVHGLTQDPTGRVSSAEIFSALGLPPVHTATEVHARWAAGQPAFMPLEVLNPGLARLLAVRQVLGLRNSGHTIAKILPVLAQGLRVINHTHPEYAVSLAQYLGETGANAVLMRGTEGEPVADARRLTRLAVYLKGALREDLSSTADTGPLTQLPVLPASHGAEDTARHIQAVLAGEVALPVPLERQVAMLLRVRATMDALEAQAQGSAV